MPGINDSPAQVNEILELCGEAGATSISGIALHLRGEVRSIFFDWLRQYRPDLVPRYEQLYAEGGNMDAGERRRLGALVRRGGRARPRRPRDEAEPPAAVGAGAGGANGCSERQPENGRREASAQILSGMTGRRR